MTTFIDRRYPQYAKYIREMAEVHKKSKDKPLHLAICFAPKKKDSDIYLFEAIKNFGGDAPDPLKDLFHISFPGSEAFPVSDNERLHLILANPRECEQACQKNWREMRAIRKAIAAGNFEVLYKDKIGRKLMGAIQNG